MQRELERYPPTTLDAAMRLAERIDAIDYKYSSSVRNDDSSLAEQEQPWQSSAQQDSGPAPMELGTMYGHQRLSDADRDKLRVERRCFYCHEPGHIKITCPKRRHDSRANSEQRQ